MKIGWSFERAEVRRSFERAEVCRSFERAEVRRSFECTEKICTINRRIQVLILHN